jgi:hypothetical protein
MRSTQPSALGPVVVTETIPQDQALVVRGGGGPAPLETADLPAELVELLREHSGDQRVIQAQGISQFLSDLSTHFNRIFRVLIFAMGAIHDQHLYVEIGLVNGQEFKSISDLWRFFQIDEEVASLALRTHAEVVPYLQLVAHLPVSQVITDDFTPEKAKVLRDTARRTKRNLASRATDLTDEEVRTHQEAVLALVRGDDAAAAKSLHSRHTDATPAIVALSLLLVTDDGVPHYVVQGIMGTKEVEAARQHKCQFAAADDAGTIIPWDGPSEDLDHACQRYLRSKRASDDIF